MMKRLLLFALLLLTQYSFAQIPKPKKNTNVNDFAHVLSKDQINSLNRQIYAIEKASAVQIDIVLVKTVPRKYTIDKFAVQIGRKWHVGEAGNGIVYVAAINQHKQHIELDSAALKKLSTVEQGNLLDAVKPYFRQKDYNGGLTNLVQQLSQHFVPPPAPAVEPVAQKAKAAEQDEPSISPWVVVLGLFGFGGFAIFTIFAFIRMCIKHGGDGWGGYSPGTSFFDRCFYRRNRWGNDRYYHTTNNYYDNDSSINVSSDSNNDDDDDNRRNSSSSSGGGFSNSGGSTSDW